MGRAANVLLSPAGAGVGSVHRVLGGVTVAGDDFNLYILALLIFHLQRAAIRADHLHFQLAVGAVELVVGGMVGERVLLANVLANILEDFIKLGLKTREEGAASGHRSKILQLVVGLQVVDARHVKTGHSVGNAGAAVDFAILAQRPPNAHGKNRYILGVFDFLGDLVQRQLAEGVDPGRDQNNVLFSFDAFQSIQGVI